MGLLERKQVNSTNPYREIFPIPEVQVMDAPPKPAFGSAEWKTWACEEGTHMICENPICKCECHHSRPKIPTESDLVRERDALAAQIESRERGYAQIVDAFRKQIEELKSAAEHDILVHAESHARSVREKDELRRSLEFAERDWKILGGHPLSCNCVMCEDLRSKHRAALRASEPKA